jgi:site-specific DNA recombinase
MIERTCDGESAFDVIVAHSVSQFFRDAFGLEFYLRKLAKHGVGQLGDDPTQVMMRQVIALFDNAKRVLRSVKENAVEVARRASRIDKKLAIDPVEAETVRLMFKLFLRALEHVRRQEHVVQPGAARATRQGRRRGNACPAE